MIEVTGIYGDVDNLSGFVSPEYGQGFDFMTDERVIQLAQRMVDAIVASDYRQVAVSETGANPLAYVCEKLLKREGVDVCWHYLKFPREPLTNIFPLVAYHLADEEKEEVLPTQEVREEAIRNLCAKMPASTFQREKLPLPQVLRGIGQNDPNPWQGRMADRLKGTKLAEIVAQPFLFFDEYVDSGTTLRNAEMYLNFFGKANFKILSFFMRTSGSGQYDSVFLSTYDEDTQLECFESGAYPFENRVDLIGHFYFMNDENYQKVTLKEIRERYSGEDEVEFPVLLEEIDRLIGKSDLVTMYRNNFTVPEVIDFVGREHLLRQFLLVLEEETHGKGAMAEFLWQLADMYGPAWTPMPKANHLDFFSGTDKSRELIKCLPNFSALKEMYLTERAHILTQASDACLGRKYEWYERMNRLLEE